MHKLCGLEPPTLPLRKLILKHEYYLLVCCLTHFIVL